MGKKLLTCGTSPHFSRNCWRRWWLGRSTSTGPFLRSIMAFFCRRRWWLGRAASTTGSFLRSTMAFTNIIFWCAMNRGHSVLYSVYRLERFLIITCYSYTSLKELPRFCERFGSFCLFCVASRCKRTSEATPCPPAEQRGCHGLMDMGDGNAPFVARGESPNGSPFSR